MSTMNGATPNTTFGRKKGIRDIPENLRKGYRMAPGQLRFCVTAAVVLVLAIFIVMFIAGNRASNGVAINEAVRLAKKYSSESAPAFVNGVLAALVPEQTEE